jgi:thrombospondin type 3 repeat protein
VDQVDVIDRRWLAWIVVIGAAVLTPPYADGVGAQFERPRAPVARVEASNDVDWLERIAASSEAAREAQGRSAIGQPKELRVAAYARLGAIGTAESLAAVGRVERALASRSLTGATLPLDQRPAAGLHVGDPPSPPVAQIVVRDTTYAVVPGQLLGGFDFFLVSTRAPDDPASWSRPKLIAPARAFLYGDPASLALAAPRILTLTYAQQKLEIALDDVERDSDGDGWTDREEARLGTNPRNRDTDRDGVPDGDDVCPLFARPPADGADEATAILQKAVFATFAVTGSRDLLYVTPDSLRFHVAGYGGPILFDRPIPRDGDGAGGTWVTWKIASRQPAEALVQLSDWEGMLAAGGVDVRLKKINGGWVVISVQTTWIS